MKKAKFGADRAMKEGSAKDMREDKKLAKKHGMSMKEWESSEMDKRHDEGTEGMAAGGKADKDKGRSKAELLSQIKQKASQIAGANRAMPAAGPRPTLPAQRPMPSNKTMPAPMRPTQQAVPASAAPAPTAPRVATPMPQPMRPTQQAVPAPTTMKKGGCVRGMKAGGVTSAEMKKVGRNLARVANQKANTSGSSKGTMTATKSSGSTAKISKRGWGIARGG